jgi:type II secretory pathway component PulK
LIVTLWTLVILTVFALALGERASLEVKLAEYQRDKLRAKQLAWAAIERAIWEKLNDTDTEIDALHESWANNKTAFQDIELGDETFTGTFTVSYSLDAATLYGLEDEQGKININTIDRQVLVNLFEDNELGNAYELADSILAWRGSIQDADEERHYADLDLAYPCKKEEIRSLAELLLVREMTPEILDGIAPYLSIYGDDDKVNINTASQKVLSALLGDGDLAEEIMEFRKGEDEEIGTVDDQWFTESSFDLPEWHQLRNHKNRFTLTSSRYTIHVQAEVKKARKSIKVTVDLSNPAKISYLACQNS